MINFHLCYIKLWPWLIIVICVEVLDVWVIDDLSQHCPHPAAVYLRLPDGGAPEGVFHRGGVVLEKLCVYRVSQKKNVLMFEKP